MSFQPGISPCPGVPGVPGTIPGHGEPIAVPGCARCAQPTLKGGRHRAHRAHRLGEIQLNLVEKRLSYAR